MDAELGSGEATAQVDVYVSGAGFVLNPKTNKKDLYVYGTSRSDRITLSAAKKGRAAVNLNGRKTAFAVTGRIYVYGLDGSDLIDCSKLNRSISAWGGRGNDRIIGSRAPSQLFGEAGKDVLIGNGGRDVLRQ